MFNADNPIETLENDLLGRAVFAKSFGKAILEYKSSSSIVIGLLGEWGSGKTSITNMALQHIDQIAEKDKNPIVVWFNPWNFSDQNQLVTQFFKQLSSVLKRRDVSGNYKLAAESLETLGSLFAPLVLVPGFGVVGSALEKVAKNASSVTKELGVSRETDLDKLRDEIDQLLSNQWC